MGVYTRFKKDPNGFRALVELLESTAAVRREKMIEVGMEEDKDYTEKALAYLITFADILAMGDDELREVVKVAPPRFVAYAINPLAPEVKERFLRCAPPRQMTELRDFMDAKIALVEVGGAQLKLVQTARACEKRGLIKTKIIPG